MKSKGRRTAENHRAAAGGEDHERSSTHPEFARVAREEPLAEHWQTAIDLMLNETENLRILTPSSGQPDGGDGR